jgi:hypothetical protein
MEKRIIVRPEKVYGRTLYYPVCDISKMFLKIQGGKTLSFDTISVLADADFNIEVKAIMPKLHNNN